jgi:sorbose reductase
VRAAHLWRSTRYCFPWAVRKGRERVNVTSLFDLHGKNALVTGASSGIGKQVALAYAQAGAAVAIAARRQEPLQELAAEIVAGGGTAVPITCDVTQPESVAAMLNRANDDLGAIDIAVCNAGIITLNSLLDMPLEEFQSIQNTNVNGVFLTAQAAAKAMVAQQRPGTIITTASMSGHIANTPQQVGHYCASKAAVIHLTKAMAVEFAPYNIRVNSVSPGYILTELVQPLSEYHASWEPKIPLGRLGRPEELVGLYLYLASDASSYMTGSDIVIDGGYTCW